MVLVIFGRMQIGNRTNAPRHIRQNGIQPVYYSGIAIDVQEVSLDQIPHVRF